MSSLTSPILVVGPGRCGTSTTARLLHTELGVSMGTRFREPDPTNPKGYYEDLDFVDLNKAILDAGWGCLAGWLQHLQGVVADRNASGIRWGVKDPRLCYFLPYYLALCPGAKIVRCMREEAQILESLVERCHCNPQVAREEYRRREALLNMTIGGREDVILDFSETRTDEDLRFLLAPVVGLIAALGAVGVADG